MRQPRAGRGQSSPGNSASNKNFSPGYQAHGGGSVPFASSAEAVDGRPVIRPTRATVTPLIRRTSMSGLHWRLEGAPGLIAGRV